MDNWEELQDDFCYSFSLYKCMESLPRDFLDFERSEGESIGAAWASFSHLLASSSDLSIPDDVSLCIFYSCLDMESTEELDIIAGGSFEHHTPLERREILDSLLETSSSHTDCWRLLSTSF